MQYYEGAGAEVLTGRKRAREEALALKTFGLSSGGREEREVGGRMRRVSVKSKQAEK